MKKLLTFFILLSAIVSLDAQTLPSVRLKDIHGKTINTRTLSNNGKPLVISFFATWCKPCMRELRAIDEVYEEWQAQTGVKLVLISIDDAQNSSKVKPLVDGEGWDFEVLLDSDSEFARLMQVQSIPHVFVINAEGKIVYNHMGYAEGGENELYKAIKSAL